MTSEDHQSEAAGMQPRRPTDAAEEVVTWLAEWEDWREHAHREEWLRINLYRRVNEATELRK